MCTTPIAVCFIINTCLHQVSDSFFVTYTAGDIYEFMEKQGVLNRTTATSQKPTHDECDHFLPKMVIIEPDRVLWPFDVGTDVVKPFLIKGFGSTTQRPERKNRIWNEDLSIEFRELTDCNGTLLALHKDSVRVIVHLVKKGIRVAVAETTGEIIVMRHLLHLFDLDHLFDFMELDCESAVDHVKTIKEESGFDYQDIIYFGANKSVLNEIKSELNMITTYVNPASGISIKHVYKAIYIYNIKPYTHMVDGKPQYLGKIVSEENAHTETKRMIKVKQLQRMPRRRAELSFKTLKRNITKIMPNNSLTEEEEENPAKVQRTITKTVKQQIVSITTSKKLQNIVTLKPGINQKSLNTSQSKIESKRKITKKCKTKTTCKPKLEKRRKSGTATSRGKQNKLNTAKSEIESQVNKNKKKTRTNKTKYRM